ncbi:hypothetical protein [Cytobacillus gottheilii]|uniref:hypothetical protein n=1 Tax=Cytobacillus gottheilii TaxID=859144 RepID=UPI000A8EF892
MKNQYIYRIQSTKTFGSIYPFTINENQKNRQNYDSYQNESYPLSIAKGDDIA